MGSKFLWIPNLNLYTGYEEFRGKGKKHIHFDLNEKPVKKNYKKFLNKLAFLKNKLMFLKYANWGYGQ